MCIVALGDVNGDALTNQVNGNTIRVQSPSVTLLAGSNQAVAEGSTTQTDRRVFTATTCSAS